MIMKKNTALFLTRIFPALVTGLALTLSFPDTGFYLLAWVALVPLMISLKGKTPRQAFLAGLAAGMVHYLTLVYWLVQTLVIYGGVYPLLAVSCLVLLSLYLSLYLAVFCVLMSRRFVIKPFMPLAGAALWVGLEYIRTYFLTGFPWGALGYSQFPALEIIQIADISGVYGISFLLVLANLTIVFYVDRMQKGRPFFSQKEGRMRTAFPGIFLLVLLVSVSVYGRCRIEQTLKAMDTSPKASIAVVQGNIKQDLKWDRTFVLSTIERYLTLSRAVFPQSPDLIIWPETAMPFYYNYDATLSEVVDRGIRQIRTQFLIGSPAITRENDKTRIYNRAFMVDRFSIVQGSYDKIHLVPFGEYVPLENLLTFVDKITMQAGNFSPGKAKYDPLPFASYQTGVLICFEILFPRIAARFAANGAHLIAAMTNDAWFGYSSATAQHFSIAVFRAIETRRCVARAANTGISGFIDPTGAVLKATPVFAATTATARLPMMEVQTVYTRIGDVFAIVCTLAICLIIVVNMGIKKFRRQVS